MKRTICLCLVIVFITVLAVTAQNGGRGGRLQEFLVQRYDGDGDGQLSDAERQRMRTDLKERRAGAEASASPTRKSTATSPAPPPQKLSGLYGQGQPTMPIVQKDLELQDKARGRTIPFQISYPQEPGPWPVIVWSHGLFGSQDAYEPLTSYWASHGYVVLQPSHTDSVKRGKGDLGKGMAANTADWANRPEDISFLISSLAAQPGLAEGRADMSHLGVGGHSFGAHTTLLLAGAEPKLHSNFSDPRPKAFLAISPQGEGRLLDEASWTGLKRPMLFISGDNDSSPGGEKARWRLAPFHKCPAGSKYLMWIKGAYHNFGGISGTQHARSGPIRADHVDLVRSATLAFWDDYLKESSEAARVIGRGSIGTQGQKLYRWEER